MFFSSRSCGNSASGASVPKVGGASVSVELNLTELCESTREKEGRRRCDFVPFPPRSRLGPATGKVKEDSLSSAPVEVRGEEGGPTGSSKSSISSSSSSTVAEDATGDEVGAMGVGLGARGVRRLDIVNDFKSDRARILVSFTTGRPISEPTGMLDKIPLRLLGDEEVVVMTGSVVAANVAELGEGLRGGDPFLPLLQGDPRDSVDLASGTVVDSEVTSSDDIRLTTRFRESSLWLVVRSTSWTWSEPLFAEVASRETAISTGSSFEGVEINSWSSRRSTAAHSGSSIGADSD